MDVWTLSRRAAVATCITVAASLFAGCGETSKPEFSAEVPEGAPRVDQSGLKFSPSRLVVKVGEKVYFTNSETALHKVQVDDEAITGDMQRGNVAAYAFEVAGEYELTCPYHPQMKATVVVE